MTISDLRDGYNKAERALTTFRGALRRAQPNVIEHQANAHLSQLSKANEAIRRLPRTERDRITGELRTETRALRQAAARVARFHAHGVLRFVNEARTFIEQTRRDTEQSFPEAYHGVSADGLATLGLLRVQLRTQVAQASVAELQAAYAAALARQDAAGLVEAQLIEARVLSNQPLTTNATELSAAKALREYVENVMELRVPDDLPDLDGLQHEADRQEAQADVLKVLPANPSRDEMAAAAFANERALMFIDGEKSQADFAREMTEAAL